MPHNQREEIGNFVMVSSVSNETDVYDRKAAGQRVREYKQSYKQSLLLLSLNIITIITVWELLHTSKPN